MKWLARLSALAGAVLAVVLILREGVHPLLSVLAGAGPWLLITVPVHLLFLFFDVLAWRKLIPGRTQLVDLLGIATVREAVNRLLPVAGIGGEVLGVRLLALRGIDFPQAAASVLVEVVLTLLATLAFALLGLACLLSLQVKLPNGASLALAVAALAGSGGGCLWLLLNGSLFSRLTRMVAKSSAIPGVAEAWADRGARLDEAIREVLSKPKALVGALTWQIIGLLVTAAESFLALRLIGSSISFAGAVSLEGLFGVIRTLTFFVPAELGVQEASLLGFGALLGVSPVQALALSLAKRLRVLLLGVPSLLTWQWFEYRNNPAIRTGS